MKNGGESLKIACLQFIASLVQNDEKAQKTAFEENWFKTILEMTINSSCPNSVLSSALSPISGNLNYFFFNSQLEYFVGLTREKHGYQYFMKNNGVQSLTSWLNSGIDRCRTKSAFIIYNLIEEDWNRQSDFANEALIESIRKQLKPPHNQTTEMLARSLYCICKNSTSFQFLKSNWGDLNSNLESLISEAKKDDALEVSQQSIYNY